MVVSPARPGDLKTRIRNSIRAVPLQHRLFKQLYEDDEAQYLYLTQYTEIRWPSKGKVVQNFINLTDYVKTFLEPPNQVVDSLSDYLW
jgi:hypothetical protein